MFPKKLKQKLAARVEDGSLRSLSKPSNLIDFSSNDYLGFAFAKILDTRTQTLLQEHKGSPYGATGSRLLSGNYHLYDRAEELIARFHESETALMFNSGYDANIGFFQSVPQRTDFIIYDEFIHASIRDGIQISQARGYKFKHNDLKELEKQIARVIETNHLEDRSNEICLYVVTESVFSMDGDCPDLKKMVSICKSYNALLIVDEAHAIGVCGNKGQGLVQALNLQDDVFARIVTFGKSLGSHGAAIVGSTQLIDFHINFARSFIYTTGLSPHTVAHVIAGYELLGGMHLEQKVASAVSDLQANISYFNDQAIKLGIAQYFIESTSAIHCAIIPGNKRVKEFAQALKDKGYDVRPILSPTIPIGQERLRICLHAYNTKEDISGLLIALKAILS